MRPVRVGLIGAGGISRTYMAAFRHVPEGEVVAVGPGRLTKEGERIALQVDKGDRILIGKYSGTDVKIDGDDYVILREDDVLATIPKK